VPGRKKKKTRVLRLWPRRESAQKRGKREKFSREKGRGADLFLAEEGKKPGTSSEKAEKKVLSFSAWRGRGGKRYNFYFRGVAILREGEREELILLKKRWRVL